MTYEEAINYLKPISIDLVIVGDEVDISGEMLMKNIKQALDMAIDALEKQIAKKPIGEKYKLIEGFGNCPNCNNFIDDMSSYRVCSRCGQAIDWEETK